MAENRIAEIDAKITKLAETLARGLDEISGRSRDLAEFGQALLLVLADLAVLQEPGRRLVRVLQAATVLPAPILEHYIDAIIRRVHDCDLEFSMLADALVRALGETARETVRVNTIAETYGYNAAREWQSIVGRSGQGNPTGVSVFELTK